MYAELTRYVFPKRAGVKCRLHDMRHTVATKMAEAGTPEITMLALLGHMSRAMLEPYSHIHMQRSEPQWRPFAEADTEGRSSQLGPLRRPEFKWGPHKSPLSGGIDADSVACM
jgi:hypothetical protein